MENKYFDFLCRFVKRNEDYSFLLEELYDIRYISLIPNDDNRGVDGEQLRENFIDEVGQQALSLCPIGPCNVLEMLIGLSIRLEFETSQSRWEKSVSEWFWILIDNLGLTGFGNSVRFCDERRSVKGKYAKGIEDKVQNMLERKYDTDGNGGLFPLKNPKKDQRRVEIWYQMSEYMAENYPF